MPRGKRRESTPKTGRRAETYRHSEATNPLRPDAGTQSQFRKKKPPKTYRYDSSLSPALHGRLPTKAIIETLKRHKSDKQLDMFNLFGDPRHSIVDQVLRAYEYRDKWVNRMILGDSLVVMNSLLHSEGLGGQG